MRAGPAVGVIVATSLIGGVAWADRDVHFEGVSLVVRIPDDWIVEGLAFQDGVSLSRPGGAFVGAVVARTDTTCDEMVASIRGVHTTTASTTAVLSAAWSGVTYREDDGSVHDFFCRAVGGGIVTLEAPDAELSGLAILVDNATLHDGDDATPGLVQLRHANLSVELPAGWTSTESDAYDTILDASGDVAGNVTWTQEADCDGVFAKAFAGTTAGQDPPVVDGWSGKGATEPDGIVDVLYCRSVVLSDGKPYQLLAQSDTEDVTRMLPWLDAAITRYQADLAPVQTAAELDLHLRAGWTAMHEGSHDAVRDRAGVFVGEVGTNHDTCEVSLDLVSSKATHSSIVPIDVPGWQGRHNDYADGSETWMYCRELDSGITVLVFVADPANAAELARAAEDAATRKFGGGKQPPAASLSRFLPNRFEIGFSRLTNGNEGTLEVPESWGATFNVEKTLYGGGLPAWGYRARVTPTGAGVAGYLEGGLGASFKGFEVQAVAGFGAAGSRAPLSVQGGVHAGLTMRFLEVEGGYRWTGGGTDLQVEGRFGIPGSVNTYTMGIGYERREESSLFTIDLGIARFPDLD